MNLSYFIAKKITGSKSKGFASTIHTIAMVSIGVGLAAAVVSFLIMKGFQETVKNKLYNFSGHLVITKFSMSNSPEEQPMNFHTELFKNPEKFPFIKHVQEFAHKAGLVKTEEEVLGVIIKGVGKSFDQKAFQENILEGRFINLPDSGYANEVVLSKTIANTLNATVGTEIIVHFFQNPPRFRKLKVVGIYETNLSEYYDNKIIIGDIRMIQRLNDWDENLAGGIEVVINLDEYDRNKLLSEYMEYYLPDDEEAQPGPVSRIFNKLEAWWTFDYNRVAVEKAREDIGMLNDYDQNIELIEDKYLQVFEWLNLISRQVNILLGIILTVICVNMISIVLILVMERTQMIGLLKALGARDGLIRSVFIHQGVNLIVKGLILGNVIALAICWIQYRFRIIKLNPRDYYMSFVPVSWHWDIVVLLNVLTLIVVTAVLLLPTMAITRINPIKAIRFD